MKTCLLHIIIFVLTIRTTIKCKTMVFLSAPIPCDFEKYPSSGCEDSIGSYCDLESSRCHCKIDHPIRLFKYCLRYVGINETCYTSRQCNETFNAACYILGTEYDHSGGHNVGFQLSDWPEGKCRCRLGHQFDLANGTCVKKTIGSWCNTDRDCTKENFHSFCNRKTSICECVYGYIHDPIDDTCSPQRLYGSKCRSSDDCSRDQLVCTGGRCKCPKGYHWDAIYPGNLCKPNSDSNSGGACAHGYKWDSERDRCVEMTDLVDGDGLVTGLSGEVHHSRPVHRGRGNSSATTGNDEDDSLSMTSIVMIVLANLVILLVFLRYWYVRKREDSEDDLTERGHIRPTLKPYYGDHLIHGGGVGNPMIGGVLPIDTNGIKCPLSMDDSVIDCDGINSMIKCTSTSSSPGGQQGHHGNHHHPIHPTLSDTIVPYDCPIGHCQANECLDCEVVGCHQIAGGIGVDNNCNNIDITGTTTLIEGVNGHINNVDHSHGLALANGLSNPLNDLHHHVKSGINSKQLIVNNFNGETDGNADADVDDGLGSLMGNHDHSSDHSQVTISDSQSVNRDNNNQMINQIDSSCSIREKTIDNPSDKTNNIIGNESTKSNNDSEIVSNDGLVRSNDDGKD